MTLRVRWLLAVLLPALTLTTLLAGAPRATAVDPPGPHDPLGQVTWLRTNSDGSVRFYGWGADPDNRTKNVTIFELVDGKVVGQVVTSQTRPQMTQTYHLGPTPGFDVTVRPATRGLHVVCVAVLNWGLGVSRLLRCVTSPAGSALTSAQNAARSPLGVISLVSATASSLRVAGWGIEPDFMDRRIKTVLYVDGYSVMTTYSHNATAAQQAAGAGEHGAFDITVPVSRGAHLACVWFVNVAYGSNTSPGCRAIDTRGPAGSGTVTEPAVNKAAVTEALKHIGQRYVWGAAGPTTFDCSGLVLYSYAKAGMTGIPHQSGMQFNLARVIPASRAVPGDLVFYHDGVGNVYHVGIYLSPGDTVAAIDTAEGVNHQPIWNPSIATYGSLTHT